jgi:hypothetical protein
VSKRVTSLLRPIVSLCSIRVGVSKKRSAGGTGGHTQTHTHTDAHTHTHMHTYIHNHTHPHRCFRCADGPEGAFLRVFAASAMEGSSRGPHERDPLVPPAAAGPPGYGRRLKWSAAVLARTSVKGLARKFSGSVRFVLGDDPVRYVMLVVFSFVSFANAVVGMTYVRAPLRSTTVCPLCLLPSR